MKNIIKNRSNLGFLNKPVESLERQNNAKIPNMEIVRLYRDVMKMTLRFTWANEDGQSWKEILQRTARTEFEQMKGETDTVKIAKFMISWRDSLMRIHEKVNDAQMKIMKHIDDSRTDKNFNQRNDYTDTEGKL